MPYTRPEAPCGVAERIIKSREGAATPRPMPITTNRLGMNAAGANSVPMMTAMKALIIKQITTVRSGEASLLAIYPPKIIPPALPKANRVRKKLPDATEISYIFKRALGAND